MGNVLKLNVHAGSACRTRSCSCRLWRKYVKRRSHVVESVTSMHTSLSTVTSHVHVICFIKS